ncbi:hypothetical protein J6590_074675 [Homalodisca vitripennis]|nr:hypothetical protein J6590_074675 [Homalodisca vitripennis]
MSGRLTRFTDAEKGYNSITRDYLRFLGMKIRQKQHCNLPLNSAGITFGWFIPSRTHHWAQQKPVCHLNLGNLMDVYERHITNRKCRDSGVHGQFNKSSLQWEMTVGVGGVCFLTSEVLTSFNKGVLTPAYFDRRGWFRAPTP